MLQINLVRYAAVAATAFYCLNAIAECKGAQNLPSEQTHVEFRINDKTISNSDREKFREWVAIVNEKYAIQNWITIVGSAADSEQTPKVLAMNRAVTVAREALQDGLVNAPLQLKAQVYPTKHSEAASSETREVTVEISPGCPNNCCDGQ